MALPAQLRAARALIGWSQADLAKAARVSEISVKNIERGATDPRVSTMTSLRTALEEAGVVFLPENGGGAGVRLFKESLTGWVQCEVPFPGIASGIQDTFEKIFMLRYSPDVALFGRTSQDFEFQIFLLSPAAARFSSSLPGDWAAAQNPSLFGWSLLVGVADAHRRLGIRSSVMRRG